MVSETHNLTAELEQACIAATLDGDAAAFNRLVQFYETRVFNLCYRMLGDYDSAADAAQDAFLLAYRKLHTFRGGSFRSWLFRIATNTCYDVLRARKRRPSTSLDQAMDDPDHPYEPVDGGELPDEFVSRRELANAIQAALLHLPPDQRSVLILIDIQGMAYQEVADTVGANLGTVKSRLSRARARLRDLLRAGEHLPPRYRYTSNND